VQHGVINVTLPVTPVTIGQWQIASLPRSHKKKIRVMSWSTVYIRGKDDFQAAIIKKLERTWMQGSPEVEGDLVMFWLPYTATLQSLKRAIGSRLIFKYRLHFITNLNSHLKIRTDDLTRLSLLESEMVKKMVTWDQAQRDLSEAKEVPSTAMNRIAQPLAVKETGEFPSPDFPAIKTKLKPPAPNTDRVISPAGELPS
jgi:hypothetical protein